MCVHTRTQAQRSVARGCVSVHMTRSRAWRGALVFCVCWGGLDLLPLSVSTFQSQLGVCARACVHVCERTSFPQPLSLLSRPKASPAFPHSSLLGCEKSSGHLGLWGWGKARGQFFFKVGDSLPPPPTHANSWGMQ